MKIAINCRTLNKRHGGPKRYLLNLLIELFKIDKKNDYYLLLNKNFDFNGKLPSNFRKIILYTSSKLLFEYFLVPIYVNRNNFDLYFVPDAVFSPIIKARKIVTTYHDIIYFEKKQKREFKFIENMHHKIMIPICKNLSSKNICVSNFTQKRSRKILNLKNSKVILEGIEEKFKPIKDKELIHKIIKKYNLKMPFIFYIGSLSPRKNPIRIIHAFNSIKHDIPHTLYFFGGYSWRDKEVLKLINNTNDNRIEKKGFVNEEDLIYLYNAADLFVYPSLYEGFGLPILEAQACGCPVITSNLASMPEVANNSAILINPYNVKEISKVILKTIKDQKLKNDLVKKGLKNVKRFSWKKCARETLKVYEEICNGE